MQLLPREMPTLALQGDMVMHMLLSLASLEDLGNVFSRLMDE